MLARLGILDFNVPYTLYTDASALGFATVLMQPDTRGKKNFIA